MSQPAKLRRLNTALTRQDRFSVEADILGRSFLETKAVGEKVDQQYVEVVEGFVQDCARLGLSLGSPKEVDYALIEVFDEKFFNGMDGGVGHYLLTAI